jgi:site-specific DNA recombinase
VRAVIYKRVSVLKSHIDGTSLDVQQERLEAYAKAQGWEVIGTYEDAGISGKDTNRPQLQRMLKDAENGRFDAILVYKLDRLSRSVSDFHKLAGFLDKHSITLVSVTQHLDTSSPTGRLLRNILVDFANFERELITERIVDNKTHRAQEGKWNGGFAPLGYRLVNKKLELVPEEAEKVKKAYQLYLSGQKSMRQVAKESGIAFSRLQLILTNPIYAGKLAWGKTKYKNQKGQFERINQDDWIMADGDHEAIITFDEWKQVQDMKKQKQFVPMDRTGIQLFKDICYCGKCGQRLYFYTSGSSSYSYYRCHDTNRFEGCRQTSVKQEELERKVVRKIEELLTNKSFWKTVKERYERQNERNQPEKQLKEFEQAIAKIDDKIKRLVNQLADDDIAYLIKPKLLELQQEKKEILLKKYEWESEQGEILKPDPALFTKLMQDIISNWDQLNTNEKSEGIHLLIKSVKCYDDKVSIEWVDQLLPQTEFKLDVRAKNGRVLSTRF